MPLYKESTIDIWTKTNALSTDNRLNAAVYVLAFPSVPCRIVPLAAKERFSAGVLDFAKTVANLYIDLASVPNLTHDDCIVETTDGPGNEIFYVVSEEVQKHRTRNPHWESMILNMGTPPQDVAAGYP